MKTFKKYTLVRIEHVDWYYIHLVSDIIPSEQNINFLKRIFNLRGKVLFSYVENIKTGQVVKQYKNDLTSHNQCVYFCADEIYKTSDFAEDLLNKQWIDFI